MTEDNYSLAKLISDKEIRKICKCNVFLYKDLFNIFYYVSEGIISFKNLLPMAILYPVNKDFGHWVCILDTSDGIEFFDPLMSMPDDHMKKMGWHLPAIITRLMYSANPDNIIYNHKKLQINKPGINTCGKHIITRLLCSNLTLEEYLKILSDAKQKAISADEFVNIVAGDKLRKLK